MASLIANNAIGWAQFQLNGGWKNTLTVLAGYVVVIGGLIAVTTSIEPRQAGEVYSIWTRGLLGLQLVILVIYGSSRIAGGIRRDISGHMIESNRLMPVPPLHAVMGYIFGGASQAISMALVNVAIGMFTARGAGLPVEYVLVANAVIGSCAVFLWTIVAVVALSVPGAMFWVVGPMVAFWFSGGTLALLLPGVSVLATPTQGVSVFDARVASRPAALYAAPLLCQALIGAVCIAAAMRKYRRSDEAAFTPLLALSLIAAAALTSAVGLRWFEQVAPLYLYGEATFWRQAVGSVLALMVVMTAGICAMAWSDATARHRAGRAAVPLHERSLPPLLGVALAGAIGAVMAWSSTAEWTSPVAGLFSRFASGVIVAHALAVCFLARWIYARVNRAVVIVLIWTAVTWLAPVVIDLMIRATREEHTEMGTIATWSPIGCLAVAANPGDADPRIGLAGQFALALLPVLLYHLDRRRITPRATPAAAADADDAQA